MQPQQPVAVIGAPLDLGAGRRGVDMGPSAIRYAGLQERIEALGHASVDWGDILAPVPEATDEVAHVEFLAVPDTDPRRRRDEQHRPGRIGGAGYEIELCRVGETDLACAA